MIHFAWPYAVSLIFTPFFFYKLVKESNEKIFTIHTQTLAYTTTKKINNTLQTKINKFILLLAWLLFIFCICRPQILSNIDNTVINKQQVIIAIDSSKSMGISDFIENGQSVSRLSIAKKHIKNFIASRKNDDISTIVFGDNAYLYTPFSNNTRQINHIIDDLNPSFVGDFTALNEALVLSLKYFSSNQDIEKNLILVSDGRDTKNQIAIDKIINTLEKYHIKVFCVGLGSISEDSPSSLDEETLKKISLLTNGSYYHGLSDEDLGLIFTQISKSIIEKNEITNTKSYEDIFYYPAGLLLILLVLLWVRSDNV